MAKDVEIKEPIVEKPIESVDKVDKVDKVEKSVEKQTSLPAKPKTVIGYKVTKKDGKVVKSEPIYS